MKAKSNANPALFLVIVAGLLLVFGLTGWTAWRDKSATYDEPLHFTGGWLETHYHDFRCDPEDPPLWQYYAAVGTDKTQLHFPTSGLIWDRMLDDRAMEGLFSGRFFSTRPATMRWESWRMPAGECSCWGWRWAAVSRGGRGGWAGRSPAPLRPPRFASIRISWRIRLC